MQQNHKSTSFTVSAAYRGASWEDTEMLPTTDIFGFNSQASVREIARIFLDVCVYLCVGMFVCVCVSLCVYVPEYIYPGSRYKVVSNLRIYQTQVSGLQKHRYIGVYKFLF